MSVERPVRIPVAAGTVLDADLTLPEDATGVVAFAHGSGSGRHSSRNRRVAGTLAAAGFATVLADLLTVEEEDVDRRTRHLRFDIRLLSERVTAVLEWTAGDHALKALPTGLFGASTGAAAALTAAVARPDQVRAVVSRGGRPDLVEPLEEVRCATLLVVGGRDEVVLRLNREAQRRMTSATSELVVVPGATHLFEEPGALEEVARLAVAWFDRHLGRPDGGE